MPTFSSSLPLAAILGLLAAAVGGVLLPIAHAQPNDRLPDGAPQQALAQFDTDLSRHSIDLSSLRPGGPPKDGIPSIDQPSFVTVEEAASWVSPHEPVIALRHRGEARAYPLQILTFHEIVNDEIGGTPVAVTFCPLCYSAIVFERVLQGEPVEFGVSGLLRKSDLVMYDRRTESLWQQLTGEAVVGTLTGTTLDRLPAQILSFEQFRAAFPEGRVLSRDTGYDRSYGNNPYAGYDDVDEPPFAFRGEVDDRLPPKMKVVTVTIGGESVAYPVKQTRKRGVVADTVGGQPVVVFHGRGAVSALDARQIAQSRSVGSVGVFDPRVESRSGQMRSLTFEPRGDDRFTDHQTGSTWTIDGRAVAGPLKGQRLSPIDHGLYFAFAWLAFRPDTMVWADGKR